MFEVWIQFLHPNLRIRNPKCQKKVQLYKENTFMFSCDEINMLFSRLVKRLKNNNKQTRKHYQCILNWRLEGLPLKYLHLCMFDTICRGIYIYDKISVLLSLLDAFSVHVKLNPWRPFSKLFSVYVYLTQYSEVYTCMIKFHGTSLHTCTFFCRRNKKKAWSSDCANHVWK